jgi:methylglutaconyl-CoA hydratase
MPYRFLTVGRSGPVEHVALNRPEVRNALDDRLVAELAAWAAEAAGRADPPRVVVLSGEGKAFCAGADAAWMARTADASEERNLAEALDLARLFGALDALPMPLVGRVHGAAIGGGAGLVAVCDVAVAEDRTTFGFTEVKLGIMPAVISPFVLAKIGQSAARELFLTGARFSAARAREIGLVHAVAGAGDIDPLVSTCIDEILAAAPGAVTAAKALIREVWGRSAADVAPATARAIAARRASPEGREGLRAFLDKRKPAWTP